METVQEADEGSPLRITVVGEGSVEGEIERLIDADDVFSDRERIDNPVGDLTLIRATFTVDSTSDGAAAAIERLRDDYIPASFASCSAEVLVGGDAVGVANTYLPIVIAFVLGLSFFLLLFVFRSIVVPLKAVVLNLLSVGAAYGLIVVVFQEGVGAGLLGFQTSPTVEFWIPLFLFSILFGLSMDYHVFMLSRIKERFDVTGDNSEAVSFGLRSTGAIITGGALIMVAVFGGFASGDMVFFQQMGFGLAVAIILDASISAWSSCPRPWSCWAAATGTSRPGWSGCPRLRSRATSTSPSRRPRRRAAATRQLGPMARSDGSRRPPAAR